MRVPHPDLDALQFGVAALSRAATPQEIFRQLLEIGALGAPRVAMLVWRGRSLRGWGCHGYPAEAASRLRALSVASAETWLARTLDSDEVVMRSPDQHGPDFGQPQAVEAWGFPIRAGTHTVAVLLAERAGEDPLVNHAVLGIITTVAKLRLEVDLAWRRSRGSDADTTLYDRPQTGRPSRPAPIPATVQVGLAPAIDPTEEPDQARRREARTFARLVATDIRLYNEEAVMLGRRHRDLAHRLREHLEKGKESFRRRFPDLGDDGLLLLDDAYVQVLAAGDPALLTTA